MAFIYVDEDNSLAIKDVYDQRKVVSDIGGTWDTVSKLWRVTFTTYNLDYLLAHLQNPSVSADMEEHVREQVEKEAQLTRLREMSKSDVPVRFKVSGLKGNLYNYQRLGVMFSALNGFGVLLADEMGLGKSVQAITTALYLKSKGKAKHALIVTPASLKYNWPLEIEKFTDEKYVVIDGTPEERIAKWLRQDVFFYVVNYELILEDLFGGREYKENEDDSEQTKARKERLASKARARERILTPVRVRMWDFLAVDECFPYGTMVDTDKGRLPIGYVVENRLGVSILSCDFSRNESSYKKVVRWISRPLEGNLVKVIHERGSFICTWNHRIWTEELGYIRAGELQNKRNGETHLRILPSRVQCLQERKNDTEVLFSSVCKQVDNITTGDNRKKCSGSNDERSNAVVQRMSNAFCGQNDKGEGKAFLFQEMCGGVEVRKREGVGNQDGEDAARFCGFMHGEGEPQSIKKDKGKESRPRVQEESVGRCCLVETYPSVVFGQRWETSHNKTTENVGRSVGVRVGNGIQSVRQEEICRSDNQSSGVLPNRCGKSEIEDCRRSGREYSQDKEVEDYRREEREGFVSSRVESVEILERRDFERLGLSNPEHFRVYNLEIEADSDKDHCYVADGVLVSNCHALKNHSAKRTRNLKMLRAKFRIALTGTPMDGRLEELHSVMGFVAPGLLGSKARFFQMHIETDFWGKVTGYKRLGEVSKRIEPYFIRRLKRDVLKDLPDKIYENRMVSLTTEEAKIYRELAEGGHEATEDAQAIVAVIRCKQFCNWPSQVDEDCKNTSKMESFKEVLEEVIIQNGHKALIFSQYKEMLNIIAEVLEKMGLAYLRIDGDTDKKERAAMQAKFNTDPKIDLMLGTEAMSMGLNFTAADYVINYDDNWSPSIMGQREDRCHRIGQRNVVTVVNFICKDTIEERIRAVIYGKNKITSEVLGDATDEMILNRLNPQEIARLL